MGRETIWDECRYIKRGVPNEWGEPDKIDHDFLRTLDAWVQHLYNSWGGATVVIRYGTNGTHSPNSLHYLGQAADLVVQMPEGIGPTDIILSVARFSFTGVGVYPHWNGNTPLGRIPNHLGLHLERDPNLSWRPRVPRLKSWMGIRDPEKGQAYIALSQAHLARYC